MHLGQKSQIEICTSSESKNVYTAVSGIPLYAQDTEGRGRTWILLPGLSISDRIQKVNIKQDFLRYKHKTKHEDSVYKHGYLTPKSRQSNTALLVPP